MEKQLSGKCSLVTGAGSGIGAATAKKLASLGAAVVVAYHSDDSEASAVVQAINASGGKALAVKVDVTSEDDVKRLFSEARRVFGAVNILVNGASAKPLPVPFIRSEWKIYEEQLLTNLMGSYYCGREAVKDMQAAHWGSIVSIASIYVVDVPPQSLAHYVSAKSALVGFTKSLAVELGPLGIRVNAVSPGVTDTKMTAHLPDRFKEMVAVGTPLRKIASPEDVASIIAFLCTDEARHITGANIPVCGGIHMC